VHGSPVRIFYVPAARPGRSYELTLQGLRKHARVELVDDPGESDLVVDHFQALNTAHSFPAEKVVFVDFHDNPSLPTPVSCVAYFKRSWSHPVRVQIGAVNDAGRDVFDQAYLSALRRSRIAITANPDDWEGDSRLWEAFANGPLVFVDRMHAPLEHPLVDGVHCVFDESAGIDRDPGVLRPLLESVEYFLAHPEEADTIARRGREHALLHHRAVDRVDAMLCTVESVLAGAGARSGQAMWRNGVAALETTAV
jgi:hypothetical protein